MPTLRTPSQRALRGLLLWALCWGIARAVASAAVSEPAVSGMAEMPGMLAHDAMTRESTGTSWQPDDSPMEGQHRMGEQWLSMAHADLTLGLTDASGPRGAQQSFNDSMFMLNTWRNLGSDRLAFKAMLSAEPLNGPSGMPLLYQTGETADGVHALVDRQHPHNLIMELASSYSHPVSATVAGFVYGGVAGEPALGPPAFMHRLASMDNPEAPITHHWLDSTHISYGVITGGIDGSWWRLEASVFNGREPDQHRYDVEVYPLDSHSLRLAINPTPHLSAQLSQGLIRHPESLEPTVDVKRTTASLLYGQSVAGVRIDAMAAWGRNAPTRGLSSQAWLSDVHLSRNTHALYARYEQVNKTELFAADPMPPVATALIRKQSLGFTERLWQSHAVAWSVGAVLSRYSQPPALAAFYGNNPQSLTVYTRLQWIH
jgi:hypothetical protein